MRRRIVVVSSILIFAPCLATKYSFAAAQDVLPAAQPDATQAGVTHPDTKPGLQNEIGTPVDTISETEGPDRLDSGITDSPDAQDPQSDTQSKQRSSQSLSDQQGKDHFVHDFVDEFFNDEYRIWTGPFRPKTYDSHVMMKYGIPFLLITGALIATDQHTAHWLPNSTTQVTWSGRVSQLGAPYTVAGMSAATYLLGRATHNDHARETGFLALEAVAHSQVIALVLKEITQRQRPLEGTQHGGFWEGGSSFPSGHAAGSFAIATLFAYEYREHIAVGITAYTLASIVDVSRLSARQHWLSDIFVGTGIGFLSGRYVYKQHHDPNLPGSLTSKLRPELAAREHGLGLYWDF